MTTQETDGIPKPLAGYRLGYNSHSLVMLLELIWSSPEWDGAEHSVPLAIDKLRQCLLELAEEINPGVLQELHLTLDEILSLHEEVVKAWKMAEADDEPSLGWAALHGEQQLKNLCLLADRALSRTSDLAGWYRLGAALGQAQVRIGQVDETALESELQEVTRVAGTLPSTERRLVPGLERLTARIPELRKLGPSHFLAKVLRPDEDVQPLAEKTTAYDLRLGLIALDRHIQTALRTLQHCRPRWDGDTRTLWYGDRVCKRYTRPAPSQEKILTSFQEEGWPNRIDDPLDPGKLADTIKDLQETLRNSPITLGRDGTGKGITWRKSGEP